MLFQHFTEITLYFGAVGGKVESKDDGDTVSRYIDRWYFC